MPTPPIDWHTKVAGTWLRRVLADSADQALVAGWTHFCTDASAEREAALAAGRALAANTVVLEGLEPAVPPGPEFLANLGEARARFAVGRSVGVLHRGPRRALEACRVDGLVPSAVGAIDLVVAEVNRLSNGNASRRGGPTSPDGSERRPSTPNVLSRT